MVKAVKSNNFAKIIPIITSLGDCGEVGVLGWGGKHSHYLITTAYTLTLYGPKAFRKTAIMLHCTLFDTLPRKDCASKSRVTAAIARTASVYNTHSMYDVSTTHDVIFTLQYTTIICISVCPLIYVGSLTNIDTLNINNIEIFHQNVTDCFYNSFSGKIGSRESCGSYLLINFHSSIFFFSYREQTRTSKQINRLHR